MGSFTFSANENKHKQGQNYAWAFGWFIAVRAKIRLSENKYKQGF